MKTLSILSIIPRGTKYHKQEIDRISIDQSNVVETFIDNITVSLDTTSIYNIRETNTIGNIVIEPGYYKEDKIRDLLKDYFLITDSSVTVLQDVNLVHARCLRKILFHTNDETFQVVPTGYSINLGIDILAGMSMVKIYSNIIKQHMVNTSLIDIPIYCSIGLDNTIMRSGLHIPVTLNSNQRTIEFYMTNMYDEVIELSQSVYINMSINFDTEF